MPQPINLNFFTIRFPLTAIASILHRITGVIFFIAIPWLIWQLQFSLVNEDSFAALLNSYHDSFYKLVMASILAAILYHVLAGIRHIFMDCGLGESLGYCKNDRMANAANMVRVNGYAMVLAMVTVVTSFAKTGLQEWLLQRISAIIIAIYSAYILFFLVSNSPMEYAKWHGLFSQQSVKWGTLLCGLSVVIHAWIGIWIVTTDYIKITAVRLLVQLGVDLLLVGCLVWLVNILFLG